jgi:tetratricopeptide (TPR) repeat protein
LSSQQNPETRRTSWSRGVLRPLCMVLSVLAIFAVGAIVAWQLNRPALEPLPTADTEQLEPEVRNLIASASANLAMNSRSAAAWGDLGALYFVHAFEAQSQVCFRNAEALDPQDFRWPYLLAVSLNYIDREQMLAAYRRAAERCGERAHVRLRLAEILLDRGELEDAAVQIEQVLTYAPSNSHALFAKSRLLLAQGKLAEAKSWAEQSAANADDKRAPYLLLAQLCRRTHDTEGEAKSLTALQQIPDGFTAWEDPDIAAMLSLSRGRSSRLARAEGLAEGGDSTLGKEILYEMAKGKDGSSAAEILARTLNREGKSRQAEALVRHQLLDSPRDERLYYQLGVACRHQQKYPEAEAAFRRVLEFKPDHSAALHDLGLTLLKLGKTHDAGDTFAAIVRLNPSDVSARIKYAELLLEDGKQNEAREHLKAALQVEPQQPRARDLLEQIKAGEK